MIRITDEAQKYFYKLLKKQEPNTKIKIFVINPDKNNAECGISFCSSKSITSNDTKLQFHLISIYIDEFSIPYLKNAEIDLIKDKLESKLTIKAPNIKTKKLKSNKPLKEKVEYIIKHHINPILAQHGGKIKLIEITNNYLAVIKFSGGCNGCAMSSITLKEGIEKKLLEHCPELTGIQDSTKHQRNRYSYY